MGEIKPVTTDKIILPKNLQREMMKFFAQAYAKNGGENARTDKQQTPLNTEAEES